MASDLVQTYAPAATVQLSWICKLPEICDIGLELAFLCSGWQQLWQRSSIADEGLCWGLSLHRVRPVRAQEHGKGSTHELTRLTTGKKTLDRMGKQVKSKTPAIRKDTRDRDIDRKQLTQTDRRNRFGVELRRMMMVGWRVGGEGGQE
jgi:hypothetical protein